VEPALEQADWVLPMPLSAQRLRERGFNQAALLAQQLAPDRTHTRLLLRVLHTPAQSTLDRKQRRASVQHAFAVEPRLAHLLKGKRVVLLDDVMTSGATLFAAATVVRAAGAAHISGVVLARTDAPHAH
jgi:ComF family protein